MEAKYENSVLLRLEVLNAMIALAQSIGFNLGETPTRISLTVDRADGSYVYETLSSADIEEVISKYIAEQNKLLACALTEEMVQLIKEEAIKEYLANSEKEN